MTGSKDGTAIHEQSPSDGDITLVGKDKVGVKFHTYQLKTYRSV